MSEQPLNVLAVVGSLHDRSVTKTVIHATAESLRSLDAMVDVVDFAETPLPLFDPDKAFGSKEYAALKERVLKADVFLLGTPDYHGSISSTMKNFLDHFWKEFAGKLFATVVASHEKGLTVTDQMRTVARQCYAWAMPYGVSFMEKQDATADEIVSDALKSKLQMLANDIAVYGRLLAAQRSNDLEGTAPGFLALHRKR